MRSPKARIVLLGALLLAGASGGLFGYMTYREHTAVVAKERAVVSRLDTMLALVNELAVTQRGYFEPSRSAPSERGNTRLDRVRLLSDDLQGHLAALRAEIDGPAIAARFDELAAALDEFARTDTRVRTNLANETYFAAADLVFTASAAQLRSVTQALLVARTLALETASTRRGGLQRGALTAAVGVAVLWAVGLVGLAWPWAGSTASADGVTGREQRASLASADMPDANGVASTTPSDAARALLVCEALARASNADGIRVVLGDAALAIGASGVVLWLGAGEELFPVMGHGYDARILARIGPLAREAANATALAWRSGEPQVVGGEHGRTGAIVAPLVNARGCFGALSAEVPGGLETSEAAQAITALIATQLSTIVAAWPEPSAASDVTSARVLSPGRVAVTF